MRMSSLNGSSNSSHGDGERPGLVGDAHARRLILPNSLLKYTPWKGWRDPSVFSCTKQVNLSHRLVLSSDCSTVSFKFFLTLAGTKRQLKRSRNVSSEDESSITSMAKLFSFTGMLTPPEWSADETPCTLKTSS